jgi:uncharacterized protein (TIGR03083 family)
MDHAARLDAVAREAAALVAAVAAGPLDAPVPSCPEFDVDALATHVGEFCAFWTHVLGEGADGLLARPAAPPSPPVGAGGRADWLEDRAGELVAALRAAPATAAVWTWYPQDRTAAFVARRCSHELTIHRVDAQLARGPAEPVEAPLAVDGIDEALLVLSRSARAGRRRPGTGQTLHLHGTDHPAAEWLVTLEPDGVRAEHAHAEADLALRGATGDLEMLLYQRPAVGRVERSGDGSVLDAFHGLFTFT